MKFTWPIKITSDFIDSLEPTATVEYTFLHQKSFNADTKRTDKI